MEDKFYRRLIDRDELVIDRKKDNPRILRFSWLKDNRFDGELYIDIFDSLFDHPELRNTMDWYHAGYDADLDIYFNYTNKYISIDILFEDGWHTESRVYNLKELYDIAN